MHSQANRDLKIDAFSWVFWILLQREMHRKHVDLNSCGASMVSGVIDYYIYIMFFRGRKCAFLILRLGQR